MKTREYSIMYDKQSIYFQIPKTDKEGFVVQYDDLNHFYDQLHYHPELQLIYIIEGTGDFFVGDSITPFGPGDLFLIGTNQNHIFKSDLSYYKDNNSEKSRSISVFFKEDSLGEGFFDIAEMENIRELTKRAKRSIKFYPEIAHHVGIKIRNLLNKKGFERFLEILSILNALSQTEQYACLTTVTYNQPPNDRDSERINDVINYILRNYDSDISLKEIADVANYSKPAFCRFFKQRTRKTFSTFLNEVRVSQACKLLRNSDLNISEACYKSGFNNVSNFNRQFKQITGLTPKSYANKYEKVTTHLHFTS